METIQSCPLCSHNKFATFLNGRDYFLSGEAFKIDKCESCGFVFTNPRPDFKKIDSYYQSDKYISHSSEGENIFSKIYNQVRKYSINGKIKKIRKFVKEGNALDIGCGTGDFLNALSKEGFTVNGIEPNLVAGERASKNYNLKIAKELNVDFVSKNSFNLITMWHVLEHVHDLKQYIGYIKQMLLQNGYLFIAVPNYQSYDAKHYEEFWAAYDLPRHLYHFSKESLSLLLSQFDFEIVKTLPMKFDSYYVSMLSEKYKNKKSQNFHALFLGWKSNFHAMKNKGNYSSIIYVVKAKNG